MNKKFNKFVSAIMLFCLTLIFVGQPLVAVAENLEPYDPYDYENCVPGMTNFLEKSKRTFAEYLDSHFKNEKLNSELVDQGIEAYKSFRRSVYNELDKYKLGSIESSEQYEKLDACIRLIEASVLEAKEMFKNNFNTTTVFKKSTILLDKYKTINKKLGELNFLIAQIVGSFLTFNNKIQCFVSNCLKAN